MRFSLPYVSHPQIGYSRNKVDDVAIQHGMTCFLSDEQRQVTAQQRMLFAKLRYLLINSGDGGMEGRHSSRIHFILDPHAGTRVNERMPCGGLAQSR
jgi:hypothetical protein